MAETKKIREKILDEVRGKLGDAEKELLEKFINLGEDMGLGLVMWGFQINLDTKKEELDNIYKVLMFFKKRDEFAYNLLETTLINIFERNSMSAIEKFEKEHNHINGNDEDSN